MTLIPGTTFSDYTPSSSEKLKDAKARLSGLRDSYLQQSKDNQKVILDCDLVKFQKKAAKDIQQIIDLMD